MNNITKRIIYIITGIIFTVCFTLMITYGYKTFYIESKEAVSEEYTYHFALIAEESENEYWRLIEKGAEEAAEENNIYLEYVAPGKANNDQLLKLFDRLISAQVDGIIVQGIEGERFVDLVHKGSERGIPIVTVDTDVKSSERKAYVGTDNFFAGKLAGEAVIENTTGEQFVGIITGRFEAINQRERIDGFKEAIKDYPRIHVVAIGESNITAIGATQATYEILKQYPNINALVGTSALDGVGMVEALEEIEPYKDVYITAFDVLPETIALIQDNKIDATIAQYPEKMGVTSVEVMMELQGKDLLENEIFTETKIIEKEDFPGSDGGMQ